MISFYELLFIVQLFAFIGILGVKTYNLMSICKWYDIKTGFLLFMGAFLFWGLGLVVFMADAGDEVLFNTLFRIETGALTLNVLFLIAELFFFVSDKAQQIIKPRNSRAIATLGDNVK